MQHLDRLHAEGIDAVEDPLAGPEQDRGEVERELVDTPAMSACRTVEAPPAMSTPSSPAVSRACG
jgi:hypothetical protein